MTVTCTPSIDPAAALAAAVGDPTRAADPHTDDAPLLAMLHTVPGLVSDLESLASDTIPGLRVLHYVDESLLRDTIAQGTTPGHVRRRLVDYAGYAEESGARALLVSCSSIGEAAAAAQEFVSIPILRIDAPMAELAVLSGARIGVLATLSATLGPTTRLVQNAAARHDRTPSILARKVDGAFRALRAGDRARHDESILVAFTELAAECDVIVLAQASMARIVEHRRDQRGGPIVLASPDTGMTQLSPLFASEEA